jgi:hypothetical protein
MDTLDDLWSELLSGDPARIRRAWNGLTDDECQVVLDHLRRMTEQDGWQAEQRQSAAAALRVVRRSEE